MKHINKIIILILVIQLVAIGLIVGTAHVQDMTLAKNDIEEFNNGWSMEFEDGTVQEIRSMPFYGECDSNETVTGSIESNPIVLRTNEFYDATGCSKPSNEALMDNYVANYGD